MARKFRYEPTDTAWSPGLKRGDVITARDAEHAEQLDASPAFKRHTKAAEDTTPDPTPESESES